MEVFKFFDAYSIRARLFPAIVAAAPALAALALLISWKSFGLSNIVASLGLLVLLYAISDFARARGRAIEEKLYSEHGGKPSVTMFRYIDSTIDAGSKDRYRNFLATKLNTTPPSLADEATDRAAVDAFYEQCGNWLRENTRDTKVFPILFGENATYGFRRNLFGVKWLALGLNLIIVALSAFILWRMGWDIEAPMGNKTLVVLIVAAAHAIYMLLAARRSAVWDASRAYGRQLILSCEYFLKEPKTRAKSASARKTVAKSVNTG